jgi:hypothetical protein
MGQKCDTCGKEVDEVSRVVIKSNYDRSRARPVYNCPACFQAKKQTQEQPKK